LVKRAPKETQLASGLYLPTDSTKDPNEGEVFAVGPGQVDVTGNLHATTLAPGDKVLLPEYGGTKIKLGEDEVFMFRESDILGKFDYKYCIENKRKEERLEETIASMIVAVANETKQKARQTGRKLQSTK